MPGIILRPLHILIHLIRNVPQIGGIMVSLTSPMRVTEAQTGYKMNSWPGMGTEARWLQSLVLIIALPTS